MKIRKIKKNHFVKEEKGVINYLKNYNVIKRGATFNLVKEMSDSGLLTEQGVKETNDLELEATTAHERIKKNLKILQKCLP